MFFSLVCQAGFLPNHHKEVSALFPHVEQALSYISVDLGR